MELCLRFSAQGAEVERGEEAENQCRCDEWGKTPDVWMQTAEDIFRRIQASDFLKGSNGHQWVATFDWLFSNSGNSIKVMEGNYDNDRNSRGARSRRTTRTSGSANISTVKQGDAPTARGKATHTAGCTPKTERQTRLGQCNV